MTTQDVRGGSLHPAGYIAPLKFTPSTDGRTLGCAAWIEALAKRWERESEHLRRNYNLADMGTVQTAVTLDRCAKELRMQIESASMQRLGRLTRAELESRIAAVRELLQSARAREANTLQTALEASREGDEENVWYAMALRAENKRFRDRVEREVGELEAALSQQPTAKSSDAMEEIK